MDMPYLFNVQPNLLSNYSVTSRGLTNVDHDSNYSVTDRGLTNPTTLTMN